MNRNLILPQPSTHTLGLAEIGDLLCLSFPRKLWKIVESDQFKSIRWNDAGDCVVIEQEYFQREILDRKGLIRIFETSSLKSFIRQLNLYGFSKIRMNLPSTRFLQGTKKMMIYRNTNFRRGCPFLIQRIKRRLGIKKSAPSSSVPPLPKRKRAQAPKRQAPFRESRVAYYTRQILAKIGKKKVPKKSQQSQNKRCYVYHALPTQSLGNSVAHCRQNLPQVHSREVPNNIGLNPFICQQPPMPIDPSIIGILTPLFYPDFVPLNAQITTLMPLYNPWVTQVMASTVPLSEPIQRVSFLAQPCPVFTVATTAGHQPSQ